uniref:Uncharacterized protein n=1 Tax=Aegilops tauschii TaxID=37682 RepID=M8BBL7_AEGTA
MLAVRCGGSGGGGCGGAYLTAQRTTAARSGAFNGRSALLAAGTGARELSLRVSLSPNSHPHRVGASCPWPVVPRVSKKKTRNEEWEALKTEFGRMFRPQLRNLGELFSLRRVYDIEDYQLGILFVILVCGHIIGHSLDLLLIVGTILIMVWKDIKKNYVLLDVIRALITCQADIPTVQHHRSYVSGPIGPPYSGS